MMAQAFMSDRASRHSDDSRPDTWNMAHAVREAERILAETEQRTSQSDYYIMPPWPASLPRPSENGVLYERVAVNVAANLGTYALMGTERAILADSLRAILPVLDELADEATDAVLEEDDDRNDGSPEPETLEINRMWIRNRATLAAMEAVRA